MNISGMNGDTTKHLNRQQVLRLLSTEPGISRTEIAARMGLVKMTVSNIIGEMIRSGMVCETTATGIEKPGAGRKLTGLCFSPDAPVVAGLWLDGHQLLAGIFSMELKLLARAAVKIDPHTIVEQMASVILGLTKQLPQALLGVGLALGPGWDSSLRTQLADRLNLPVFSASDTAADAAVVARFTGYDRYFCLSLSSPGPIPSADAGVRASIVVNGTLMGDSDGCTPLGLMNRGSGKLADTVSIPAICRHISSAPDIECRTLAEVQEICRDDPAGNAALCSAFAPLTEVVSNLCLAVRPEALIINSTLAGFGEELREYFFSSLHLRLGDSAPVITSARFDLDTTMYGAACLVLEEVFAGALNYDLFFKK